MQKKYALILITILLPLNHAMAEISINTSKSGDKTYIHASHETLSSLLQYYNDKYHTTSTLPASIANEQINAKVKGKSLLEATQKLLKAYNSALILGENNSISHISILPVGQLSEDTKNLEIGNVNVINKTMYQNMKQRQIHEWGKHSTIHSMLHKPTSNLGRHTSKKELTPEQIEMNKQQYMMRKKQRNVPSWR